MSIDQIAAAQVAPTSTGISFNSSAGFKSATRNNVGVYELKLDDEHDAKKLVVNATLLTGASGEIVAAPVGTGDTRSIAVYVFDLNNSPADTPFSISVQRVGS